jgi:GT2 family glycosyltransferase
MELYKYAPDEVEIVLVNDASTDEDCVTGAGWWQKEGPDRHRIRYVKNKEHLGFGKSHNAGARVANGDIFVFLSNDVVIRGNFFYEIIRIINQEERSLIGGRVVNWAGGWNEFDIGDGKKLVIPYAEGWLLSCTRGAWHHLGGFDPIYGKFDYEDIDLSVKALVSGYNIEGLNLDILGHMSGRTVVSLNIDRTENTKKNRQLFIAKWRNQFPRLYQLIEAKHVQRGQI